jgi:predicted patatin/cPLA2 family phospholipase
MFSIFSIKSLYYKLFILVSFVVASLSILLYSDNLPYIESKPLKSFDNTCNVLSLSGGGSFGAVEVGILKNIHLSEYDIITGISAGGLNSALLSYHNSRYNSSFDKGIEALTNLYSSITNDDIYNHEVLDIAKYWSYYSTKPLRKTLNKVLGDLTYVPGSKEKITLIGSANLNLGYLDVFDFNSYKKVDQVDILMSSTAIPFVFPPNIINGSTYVDGGTISNQILVGLKQKIKCNYYNITYISSHEKLNKVQNIDSFRSFTKRILKVVESSFDDQMGILEGLTCKNPSGKIYYYYPIDEMLEQYSILDMNNGAKLIDIGSNYHKVEVFDYCV